MAYLNHVNGRSVSIADAGAHFFTKITQNYFSLIAGTRAAPES